jgi:hypothetical protein
MFQRFRFRKSLLILGMFAVPEDQRGSTGGARQEEGCAGAGAGGDRASVPRKPENWLWVTRSEDQDSHSRF